MTKQTHQEEHMAHSMLSVTRMNQKGYFGDGHTQA